MNQSNKMEKTKKQFKILGFSVWRILAYFIIYSIVGYLVETIFAIITKGTLESRQSFLYGPFCGIYGLGAVVMVLFLQYFNKNNNRLFLGGFIVGSIVEYLVSLFAEIFLNVKWWDYSNMPLNINGRICVYFSILWGLLAIYFMSYFHPKIDNLIEYIRSKISLKILKVITTTVTMFLLIDCLLTVYALEMFAIRKVHENNINVENREYIDFQYEKIYGNSEHSKFIEQFFGDEKMIKTFPNLKTQDKDGNIIYFDCYVGNIKPYYYKFNFNIKE